MGKKEFVKFLGDDNYEEKYENLVKNRLYECTIRIDCGIILLEIKNLTNVYKYFSVDDFLGYWKLVH